MPLGKVQKQGLGSFFLIAPIGLEEAAAKELQQWCSVLALEFGDKALLRRCDIVKGGVEFEVGESVGLLLNRCLKIGSRILQRVHSFQTRDWGVVEKEFRTIAWKHYFPKGLREWEIAASDSRMNNEKHLQKFIDEKFKGKFFEVGGADAPVAYLRVHDNIFTVSRDTSGEHLHFRGYRQQQGEAPLRENLAAFLWAFLLEHRSRLVLEQSQIVDPFCGSGTLLFEAALWNAIVASRHFISDPWVEAESQRLFANVGKRLKPWSLQLVGIDSESEVLAKAKSNAERLRFTSTLRFLCEDSTSGSFPAWLDQNKPVILISNPPYGGKGRLQSKDSWRQLWGKALDHYQPELAIGLGPEREAKKGDRLGDWQCLEVKKFLNGGIRVAASLWMKNKPKG
ncbi:MAG: hypothetical protein RJB66_92 [Pseudomonadota bacterium]|jgi:putative N6-adenine-specific DNA methylase